MLRPTPIRLLLLSVLILAFAWPSPSQEGPAGRIPVLRARRPTFAPRQVEANYFADLQRDALVGERPNSLGRAPRDATTTAGSGETGPETSTGSGFAWSSLIAANVLEDHVKQVKLSTDANITTPVKFAGGGYDIARQDFTVLALLFAIINDYDSQVRWKNDAPALRDAFSRAAGNCKTGSPQAYAEAKLRKDDLTDVVGGNAFVATAPVEPANDWSSICDRSPLMKRLQVAIDRLKQASSNEASLSSNADELRSEASIVAAIGHVLAIDGMEDAADEDYAGFALEMRDGSTSLLAAIRTESYDDAVTALGVISQSCDRCHADWR